MLSKEQKLEKILAKYGDMITGADDLTAGAPPSRLFYLLADKLSYLLDADPEAVVSQKGVERRRRLHFIIETFGPRFLANPQVFENRNFLRNPDAAEIAPDPGITLPGEPVIWTANHWFKDDGLASVLAAKRHAYILFGALPQFFNTFDGLTAYLNGIVMVNRKVSASRRTSVEKAVRAMNYGADLLIFPEGIWNKTPNELVLSLWPGIYHIACETGAKVVPIVHYIRDCTNKLKNNPIHTVVDDPIRIDDLGEQAALNYVRDVLATWSYLMMEAYGRSDREDLIGAHGTSDAAWEEELYERVKTAAGYDVEIERNADYRPKTIVRPEQVWETVANIRTITPENAAYVAYAQNLVAEKKRQDFQRRF